SKDDGLQALVDKGYLKPRDIEDPWGRAYQVEMYGPANFDSYFSLKSAGPDGKFGTADDLLGGQQFRFGRGRMGGLGGGAMGRRGLMEEPLALGLQAQNGAVMERDVFLARAAAPAGVAGPALLKAAVLDGAKDGRAQAGGAPEPRVRQYFPETMYWN